MKERDLPSDIVKAIEAGATAYLNKSIIYSPFRLFYNLFKKNSPNTITQVRNTVSHDIGQILQNIENFDSTIFVQENKLKSKGIELLQICYNIGINLLKKKLTVVTAFRVIRSHTAREQIYDYLLSEVRDATIHVLATQIE